jgi:PAS domain-containing protein
MEPASQRQVAVLFQDITARKRAEDALQQLNETLEARVADALAERKVLADIVEGTRAFVQVADKDFRWIAINSAAARAFRRIFGILPRVGDNMLELLQQMPQHLAAARSVWQRALAGEEFVEIGGFGDRGHDRRHYEMRFNTLPNAISPVRLEAPSVRRSWWRVYSPSRASNLCHRNGWTPIGCSAAWWRCYGARYPKASAWSSCGLGPLEHPCRPQWSGKRNRRFGGEHPRRHA